MRARFAMHGAICAEPTALNFIYVLRGWIEIHLYNISRAYGSG